MHCRALTFPAAKNTENNTQSNLTAIKLNEGPSKNTV